MRDRELAKWVKEHFGSRVYLTMHSDPEYEHLVQVMPMEHLTRGHAYFHLVVDGEEIEPLLSISARDILRIRPMTT